MGHSAIKKRMKFFPLATAWISRGYMLSEISQSEKDKYRTISLIYRISRTKLMNKQNWNRLIDTRSTWEDGGLGRRGLGEKGEGTKKYILVVTN